MINENKIRRKFLELGLRNHYSEATLEVTSRCNAQCGYCYIENKNQKDLPTERIYLILDKLADAGITCLTLTGGEPFLRPDILDIIDYAIKKDFWKICLLTNGTLLTDEHSNYILDHSGFVSNIQFSIFSHHPEVNDKYIGVQGALSRILKSAEILKKGGVTIHLALNLFEFNLTEFKETCSHFKNLGYDVRTSITKIQPPYKGQRDACITSQVSNCTTYGFYTDLLHNAPDKFIEYEKNRFSEKKKDLHPLEDTILCNGLYKNICIDSRGDMLPCTSFRKIVIGNIFDNGSLYDLVASCEKLQKIKRMRKSDMDPCKTCKHNRSCNICLGLIHTETGQLTRPVGQICNYAKALENYPENCYT